MDIYTATEVAYKNGYEQGLKDATKHGYWDKYNDKRYYCSVCKSYCPYEIEDHFVSYFWSRYCPACGAAMDGISGKFKEK